MYYLGRMMYLSQDSSKLIVIGSEYQVYALDIMVPREAMISPYLNEVRTFLNVYDVQTKLILYWQGTSH